jgi:putative two-component system response regulator
MLSMNEPNRGKTPNILVVDDTPANLQLLAGTLKEWGFKARPVTNGKLALQAARNAPPDLILLDINMPEMNGYEVCRKLKAEPLLADIPVIFLSALQEMTDKVKAFEVGGVDYVTKPFHLVEMHARITAHLKIRTLTAALEVHNRNLQGLVDSQIREIVAAKDELSRAHLATIVALSKLAETRDDDTGQHIERTRVFCWLLAEELRRRGERSDVIDDAFVQNVFHSAPLHDIGKVAIPDQILLKPGRLTDEEFAIMKTHTTVGARTLQEVLCRHENNKLIEIGVEIAYAHHERWDGSGYPRGLAGEEIPLSARIMALADVYDALTNKRCYKRAFSHEEACQIILQACGSQFDPIVVKAFSVLESQFRDTCCPAHEPNCDARPATACNAESDEETRISREILQIAGSISAGLGAE